MRGAGGCLSWLSLSLLLLVADQCTKAVVRYLLPLHERMDVWPILAWVHVRNPGAAFSLLAEASGWQHWLFVCVAFGVSGWLLWELIWLPKAQRWLACAYALLLGGALGNLLDRLMHRAVTDFVLLHWFDRYYFPAFNIADMAITLAVAIWLLLLAQEVFAGDGQGSGNVQGEGP